MTRPNAKVRRVDGALGISPAETDQLNCHVGVCSSGTSNVMFAYTDVATLRADRGFGPLVEAMAEDIEDNGMAYGLRISSSVAGVLGTLSETGTSPAITATGTPNDSYQIQGVILTAGAVGTSTWQYSLDGGNTWSAPLATAATYVLPDTGVTLAFAVGSYVAGDTFSQPCSEPYYAAGDLTAVQTALLADKREFGTLHLVGQAHGADDSAKASAAEAVAAAGGSIVTALAAKYRYVECVVDMPDVAAAAVVTATTALVDAGVICAGGHADILSPVSKLTFKRSIGSTYCARVASIAIQKHPGEVRAGPLPARVKKIYTTDADSETLDAARIATLREHVGLDGIYITRGPTMAAGGSDYGEHQRVRVANRGQKVLRGALLQWLNSDLDTKSDGSGNLTDIQADAIDNDIDRELRSALVATGAAVAAYGKVSRTNDVDGTSTLLGKGRVKPKGYANFIDFDFGFTRTAA